MSQRGSKMSTVPVVWATFGFFFPRDPDDFLSRLVTMDEAWLYHYDPETKQRSMEWQHSGSPRPKKFQVQKSAGKVLASIFWDQDGILLIDKPSKGPNYQRVVLLISAGAIEGHFEGKMQREDHQRGLVLTRQCPGSPGTWNPEETGLSRLPVFWSPTLLSGSGPFGLPPFLCTEKKQLKDRHFSSDTEVISAAETWLNGQISEFFWVACKS